MRRPRVCWNEPSKHPVQRDGKFLGCRIQPMRGATCDFCATCDFNLRLLVVETELMYNKISFRSVSKPGPGNRAGFVIARTRGTPKTPWFFWGPTPGAQPPAFSGRRLPAPQTAKPAEE